MDECLHDTGLGVELHDTPRPGSEPKHAVFIFSYLRNGITAQPIKGRIGVKALLLRLISREASPVCGNPDVSAIVFMKGGHHIVVEHPFSLPPLIIVSEKVLVNIGSKEPMALRREEQVSERILSDRGHRDTQQIRVRLRRVVKRNKHIIVLFLINNNMPFYSATHLFIPILILSR